MSIEAYTNPDFGWGQKFLFFLASLVAVFLVVLLLRILAHQITKSVKKSRRNAAFRSLAADWTERLYEMIIAGTSALSVSTAYVVLNHVYALAEEEGTLSGFVLAWGNGKDFILLLMICLSCLLNTVLDHLIIPLKNLERSENASIRMLGMFYVVLLLVVLNGIGDESEYGPVMIYYLGLVVGRFVYFDASFRDFVGAIKKLVVNLPFLLLGLLLSGGLSFLGFRLGFLLERNYYIVGLFYTHLFLLAAVFVLHLVRMLINAGKRGEKGSSHPIEAEAAALDGAKTLRQETVEPSPEEEE